MSTPTYSPPGPATVDGIGPYAVPHPYGAGEIAVVILAAAARSVLGADDFTVTPEASPNGGNLVLTEAAAATHDGAQLLVLRLTAAAQQWLPVTGPRERALELQLDLMTRAVQDARRDVAGALRADRPLAPFVPVAGRALIFDDDGQPVAGPTAEAIATADTLAANVQQNASDAGEAADLAVVAAQEAAAAAALLGLWRGAWEAATAYAVGDRATHEGSTWRATAAHTSAASFATDLGSGRWEVFAAKGAPGAGTGDMLAANNLSEVNPAAARATLNVPINSIGAGAVWGRDAEGGIGPVFSLYVRNGLEIVGQQGIFGSTTRYLQGRALPRATWSEGDSEDQASPAPADIRQAITDWALARLPGYGQERQDLTGSRSPGAVYQNDTARPIEINLLAYATSGIAYLEQSPNGSTGWVRIAGFVTYTHNASATIPPGAWYRLTSNAVVTLWTELRSTEEAELLVEYDGGDVPLSIETL